MLKSVKRSLIEVLEKELIDVKVETHDEKNSNYLVDYLYGRSDVEKEITKLLYDKSIDEWILLSQVLLKKNIINSKKYNLYIIEPSSYFIMKDKKDLEKFSLFIDEENKLLLSDSQEEIKKILQKYQEQFTNNSDKGKFKNLLENYFKNNDEYSNNYIIATYELGEFLKTLNNKKIIPFKQSDFFKDELGFKGNNKYPEIVKKYDEMMKNGK